MLSETRVSTTREKEWLTTQQFLHGSSLEGEKKLN